MHDDKDQHFPQPEQPSKSDGTHNGFVFEETTTRITKGNDGTFNEVPSVPKTNESQDGGLSE